MDLIQTIIRAFSNQWYHVIGVWIFASIAQTVVTYHQEILKTIEIDFIFLTKSKKHVSVVTITESVLDKLSWLRKVSSAANLTRKLLGPLLLANICSSLLYAIMFTFYAVEDTDKLVPFLWDIADIADASVRYWIVSHAADNLRSVVRNHNQGFHVRFY